MELKSDITKSENIRDDILAVEERMKNRPDVMIGDCFPLKHTFVDGAYVREIRDKETYECPEVVGQVLDAGDVMSAIAGAADQLSVALDVVEIV